MLLFSEACMSTNGLLCMSVCHLGLYPSLILNVSLQGQN